MRCVVCGGPAVMVLKIEDEGRVIVLDDGRAVPFAFSFPRQAVCNGLYCRGVAELLPSRPDWQLKYARAAAAVIVPAMSAEISRPLSLMADDGCPNHGE